MEIIRDLWNNNFFVIGTAVFLAGLGLGILGIIEKKRKKTVISH